jgi:hypothetical protein
MQRVEPTREAMELGARMDGNFEVRVRNDLPTVTDGPFAEAKEQLARFYVLNAERSRPCPRPSVTN